MKVLMAVLYQGGDHWDEIVVDVHNVCSCMTNEQIDGKARNYFYRAPEYSEYDDCFGVYVTNERYDEGHVCTCDDSIEKEDRIWDILVMVNEHFGEEMSDLLDEDFDKLLQELAE